jgi:hypothetical protein
MTFQVIPFLALVTILFSTPDISLLNENIKEESGVRRLRINNRIKQNFTQTTLNILNAWTCPTLNVDKTIHYFQTNFKINTV